ncbi:MAG: hypothetical protein K0R34_185 [Herbinix sp.]|jgi:hypothetical protein|nr:hypothetical protein [Herbinix sp.]
MKVMRKILLLVLLMGVLGLTSCSNSKTEEEDKSSEAEVDIVEEEAAAIEKLGDHEIAFSETGYLFGEDLELKIYSGKPCEIHYTTDGVDPDKKAKKYEESIKLVAGEAFKATSVKAKAFYEDGTESETIVHTYFVGENIDKRYDTLVFSITTDPYNLYDYEYGIFVEGKLRSDWIKENPHDKIEPNDPANFNMRGRESEREVFLEVIEPDGTPVLSQKAGIRTYGGWSRANKQKSVKMYARKEYDEENNKFRYEFFPERTGTDGKVLDAFKQLVLRNCGNDNGFAFIRDELFQTLAAQAGYQDHVAVRPAAMYVNGDYRGFFWLHEVYGDDYFEDHYGDYIGEFQILEGGETFKEIDEDGSNETFVNDYTQMYDKFSATDLTVEANYQELCEQMDVENYLAYYALQVYIGNEDWPHNNYKTYRYYTTDGEVYREAPFDGKWRYLLHDLDFSTGIYGTGALVDNIEKYIGPNGEVREACPLFGQLMQRTDCREIFIKQTEDLINGAFAPKNLNKVLDEMNATRKNELKHVYGKNLIEDWVKPDQLDYQLGVLKNYAKERASHILTKYQNYFGLGEIYQLKASPAEGGTIKVNSFATKEFFTGSFYEDFNTVITATLPEGVTFDYWMVNGEKVMEEELIITPTMVKDGLVEVNCMVK